MNENELVALFLENFEDFKKLYNSGENEISDKFMHLKNLISFHTFIYKQSLQQPNQQNPNDVIGRSPFSIPLMKQMLEFLEDKIFKLIPEVSKNNKEYNLEKLLGYREMLIELQPQYPKNIGLLNPIEEINAIIAQKHLEGSLQGAQNPLYAINGTIPGDEVGTMRQVETIKQPSSGKRYRLEGYDNTEKEITLRKDDPLAHVSPSREVLTGNILANLCGLLTKQEIGNVNQLKKTYTQKIKSEYKAKGTEESKDNTPGR